MTDRNLLLMEIIQNNPGIQFREIMRMSGLKNGVLSHYLKKFEKNGVVKVMRIHETDRILSAADFRRGVQSNQDIKETDSAGHTACINRKQRVGVQGDCRCCWKITINGFGIFIPDGF